MKVPPSDIAQLLPHGPAALFVREIVSVDSGSIVTRGVVPPEGPFARAGVAPAVIALELAAQAAGVLETLAEDLPPGVPARVGYIVGLSELVLERAEVPAGRELTARVVRNGVARQLTVYDVGVTLDDEMILSGRIKIFTAPR